MEQFASNLYVESVPSGGKRKGKNTVGESSKKKPKTMQTMTRVGQGTLDKWVYSLHKPSRVRFNEKVVTKIYRRGYSIEEENEEWQWIRVTRLKGYSLRTSKFYSQRKAMRSAMKLQHKIRRDELSSKNVKKVLHILTTQQRENIALGY
jgi:hypothetical protein